MRRLFLAVVAVLLLCGILEGRANKYWIFFSDKGEIDTNSNLAHLKSSCLKLIITIV